MYNCGNYYTMYTQLLGIGFNTYQLELQYIQLI